jgi:hypothetical protein
MGKVTQASAPSNVVKNKWIYTSAPPIFLQGVNRDNFTSSIIPYHNSIKCCVAKDVIKKVKQFELWITPSPTLISYLLKRVVFMSVLWQIITYHILRRFRSTWAPRIGLLSLVGGLQLFIYLYILPISSTSWPTSTPGWYHASYKTRHDTAILTTPCPRTVYSRPADPLLPQQIHHADKHTTPAATTSCLTALLLLETYNYASAANWRYLVSAHIVVSSKQQLKTVTWLPLVLPVVTWTCFLSQPWTVTTAKLRLQA